MFLGYGKLLYYPNWWLVVKVNEDVCRYYRKLIHFYNKPLRLNPAKHGAHITIIAGKYEKPKFECFWNKYQNERINFRYNPEIKNNGEYYWMEVECERIEDIREEMGLNKKIIYPWHLTVGNIILRNK